MCPGNDGHLTHQEHAPRGPIVRVMEAEEHLVWDASGVLG
jgi:hypothetical protein